MNLLFFILLIHLIHGKFICNHVIKTNFSSKSKLVDIMLSKKYFDYYLDIVGADTIIFDPIVVTKEINFPQMIDYKCVPKITYFPMRFPKIRITQYWQLDKNIFKGRIKCSYIDFNLELEVRQNESNYADNVYVNMKGTINNKLFILPNNILKQAMHDYESIFYQIIKKM